MRYEYSLQITKMQSKINVWALDWQNLDEYSWGLLSTQAETLVLGLQGAATLTSTLVNPWSRISKDFVSATATKILGAGCAFKLYSLCRRYCHWLIKVLARWPRLTAVPHGDGCDVTASARTRKCVFASVRRGKNNIFSPVISNPHGFLISRGFPLVQQHVVKQSL